MDASRNAISNEVSSSGLWPAPQVKNTRFGTNLSLIVSTK